MAVKRRDFEVFSLSFLDCICCGFGAIILLFILSMGAAKRDVANSREELEAILQERLAAYGLSSKTRERLAGELTTKEKTLDEIEQDIIKVKALLAQLEEKIRNEQAGDNALLTDIEQLKKEIAAMQTEPPIEQLDASTPIGIPVESNYVAFVIDTSGSMRDPNTAMLWDYVSRKFEEVIRAYPTVKGVQFLDADGRFIIGRTGEWIPDSPETRKAAISQVLRYQVFSNSNPVPGIIRAIRTLHKPDDAEMKMGIYVFGDEFTDTSDTVLDRVEKLNPPGDDGKRRIVINGVGFPNLLRAGFSLGQSGVKFANLMRELTQRNGGAFVAVTEN
jgi:hypothetical protein